MASATLVSGGAINALTKGGSCLASTVSEKSVLLAASLSHLVLPMPSLVVASAQPVAGGAPVKRTVEFRSTRRGYKQRKALRKSKVHMAAQFEEAQDRVFSDSMLSDCPSCPVVHNLRDFQPQQASSQQMSSTQDAAWVFSLALQTSLL